MAATTNKKAAAGSAGGRAKGAGKAAATGKGRKNTAASAPEPEDFIGAEVLIILSFAIAVLLFLSNFHMPHNFFPYRTHESNLPT